MDDPYNQVLNPATTYTVVDENDDEVLLEFQYDGETVRCWVPRDLPELRARASIPAKTG